MINVSLKEKLWIYDAGNECKFEVHEKNGHELQNDHLLCIFVSAYKIKPYNVHS